MLSVLLVRGVKDDDQVQWREVAPGAVLAGLYEDTDYLLALPVERGQRVFVDDVELLRNAQFHFLWRPALYAGRVAVHVLETTDRSHGYLLDVSPSPAKSGEQHFSEMIECIRAFDPRLLAGESAATVSFGHEHETALDGGRPFAKDIALARIRQHGPAFLTAMEVIARTPHRKLTSEMAVLPLSRIKRLHPLALRDKRLASFAKGKAPAGVDLQSLKLRSATSAVTFDTPANRAMLALLKRFRARIRQLHELVQSKKLSSDAVLQAPRIVRRLEALRALEARASRLIRNALFIEVGKAETTESSLTQIAAQPTYSAAHRAGMRALAAGVSGTHPTNDLNIPPSWGVYELWCYLGVVELLREMLPGIELVRVSPRAASAELCFGARLLDGSFFEVLFQATFWAGKPSSETRCAWSISGQRIPDILLVHHAAQTRAMILDAKWRAGRENVLDAMVSAHIYHDALRVGSTTRPSPCLLLLPGEAAVNGLEDSDFIRQHEVGAIARYCIDGTGRAVLRNHLQAWLRVDDAEKLRYAD